MAYKQISLNEFDSVFGQKTIDVISEALEGQICSFSDEFFAKASNLLKVDPAIREIGKFTPNGAWMDGWETRRHNESFDWVIIRLGVNSAILNGFDIDTAHFNGNHCPEASVEAIFSPDVTPDIDSQWIEVLPKVPCGPSSRHLFTIPSTSQPYTHVKLNMYPDGGLARFRVYGIVIAQMPKNPQEIIDMAFVSNGGRATACSDQHFGTRHNLLLPGRGINMGDGWETKRSREPNHSDWVIIKLGGPINGVWLESVCVDTAHFIGNYPKYVKFEAMNSKDDVPLNTENWITILEKTQKGILGPNKEHVFALQNVLSKPFTHVRMTIYPDGGIKRLRVYAKISGPEKKFMK